MEYREIYHWLSSDMDLLFWLKEDIKGKYGITNPTFLIENVVKDEASLSNWMNPKFLEGKWIYYRKVTDTIFELKDYFPNTAKNLCKKKAHEAIDMILSSYKQPILCYGGMVYLPDILKKVLFLELAKGLGTEIPWTPISKYEKEQSNWRFLQKFDDGTNELISVALSGESEAYKPIGEGYYILEHNAFENVYKCKGN